MRRAAGLVALWCACATAAALEIRSYDTRLEVTPDGSARASVTVEVAGVTPGRISLPVGFEALDEFRPGEAPAGVALTPRASKSASHVDIEFPGDVPAEARIAFSFRVPGALFVPKPEEGQKATLPAGSRLLNHGFVNTQPTAIARYRVKVLLPQDSQVQAIREQLPKPRRKEFLQRVELDRFEGRQGALLQMAAMGQGDRTSMSLEVVDARRSWMWLLVLVPIAIGYLYAFRDLVSPAESPRPS